MPYIINKFSQDTSADPGWPKIINDGQIDSSLNINLIGRGKTNYGKFIAENFIRLLENFASNTAPTNAITGQIWYKVNEKSIYICTGVSSNPTWQKIPNITVSISAPSNLISQGSIYLEKNSNLNQFWIDNGSEWIRIGGLIFSNTTPTSAHNGYLWYNPNEKILRIFVGHGISDWLPIVTTNFEENSTIKFLDLSGNETLIKFLVNNDSSFVVVSKDLDAAEYSSDTEITTSFPNNLKKGVNVKNIKIYDLIYESTEDNITATGASASQAYMLTKTNNFVTIASVSSNGVMLPSASSYNIGAILNIWNLSTNNIIVYPPNFAVTIEGNPSDTISSGNKKTYILRNTTEYRIK